jgi:phage-related protein
MTVAFTPPVAPSFPLDDARSPKVNRVLFGDGYSQRSADGINGDLEKPTVKWEGLSDTEFAAIWNFFVDRGGVEHKEDAGDFTITCEWEEVIEA